MDHIAAIEQSDNSGIEKIRKLDSLRALCLRCIPEKDSVYARIMHRLGNFYRLENDWEKAIRYTREAVAVNAHSKGAQEAFLANSYYNLGLFYNLLQLYRESQHYYDSCILIGTKYADKTHIALMAFEDKAFSLYRTGDYQKSDETAGTGIGVARQAQDTLFEIALLVQQTQARLAMNDTLVAAQRARSALRLLPADAPMVHRASCFSVYAAVLGEEKKFKEAFSYYQQAFEANRALGRWDFCARNMVDLGYLCNEQLQDAAGAIRYYNRAIPLAMKTNDPDLLVNIYNNLGAAYWRQRQFRKALSYYQKGLNALPVHFTDTSVQSNPGYDMLRNVNSDALLVMLLANKGESFLELYKQNGDRTRLRDALNSFFMADKGVDLMRWKQYGEPSRLFWRNQTRKMYEQAIEACYLLEDAASAFHFFEKSRAVLLNDKLNELGARKYLSARDLEQEQALRIRSVSFQQQLDITRPGTPAYAQAQQELLNTRGELERFIRALENKYPAYYQYKYDTAVYTLAEVSSRLQNRRQALVEYFMTDSLAYILSVSGGKARFIRTGFNSQPVKELMQLCTNPSLLNLQYGHYRTLAHRLYRQLFEPLALSPGSVIISPDEYLFPFEALQSDSTNPASFLVKDYAFSYTYAAGFIMKPRPAQVAARQTFLGIAPVNYAPYLQQASLAGADASLRRIKSYYHAARCLYEGKASRHSFLDALGQSRIVQLYSHASAGSQDKEPVLFLADSVLRLSEVQLLQDTVTSLVVLSACETGIGKHARGEGVLSLARGFTLTGIPSIITTLWRIDNEATYQLTEYFHRFLSKGMPKDVALQQAKLQFMKNNDKSQLLPYFWAGGILFGETDPVPEKEPSGLMPLMFMLIAVLLAGLLFVYYRKVR
jgi:CHAT domain-containing protein/tetratricopeptide (TPR) repeat protein